MHPLAGITSEWKTVIERSHSIDLQQLANSIKRSCLFVAELTASRWKAVATKTLGATYRAFDASTRVRSMVRSELDQGFD